MSVIPGLTFCVGSWDPTADFCNAPSTATHLSERERESARARERERAREKEGESERASERERERERERGNLLSKLPFVVFIARAYCVFFQCAHYVFF